MILLDFFVIFNHKYRFINLSEEFSLIKMLIYIKTLPINFIFIIQIKLLEEIFTFFVTFS